MQIFIKNFLCSEAYLQVGLFIAQAADRFFFVNQIIKVKLNGIKYLIVGDTANHYIIICSIISSSAFQNKVEPFFRIAVKFQNFKFLKGCFIEAITGNNSILSTAFEFLTPFCSLVIKRCCVKTASKVNVFSGM